jgi:hypothetical protein
MNTKARLPVLIQHSAFIIPSSFLFYPVYPVHPC